MNNIQKDHRTLTRVFGFSTVITATACLVIGIVIATVV